MNKVEFSMKVRDVISFVDFACGRGATYNSFKRHGDVSPKNHHIWWKCVLLCFEERYAIKTWGRNSSHRFCSFSQYTVNIAAKVRLNRSTLPLLWGRMLVVLVLCIWNNPHIRWKSSDSKLRPWSDWIWRGVPTRQINSFTNIVTIVSASWFGIAYASVH